MTSLRPLGSHSYGIPLTVSPSGPANQKNSVSKRAGSPRTLCLVRTLCRKRHEGTQGGTHDKIALWDPNISLTVTFSLPMKTSTGRRPSHPISATVAPRLSTMMVLRVTAGSLSLSVSESLSPTRIKCERVRIVKPRAPVSGYTRVESRMSDLENLSNIVGVVKTEVRTDRYLCR